MGAAHWDAEKCRDPDTKGERLELHRRMAGVVETSWSLGDIDRDWAGLYNAKSTLHVRPQAALAFLRTAVRGNW